MAKKIPQPTMKKMAAVRLAVRELGGDASTTEVKNWVKEKHNIYLTDATVSNYLYTARKELRDQNGLVVTPAPVSKKANPGVNEITKPTISTLAAVREAVKALGDEAPLATVRMWVKDTYNLEMTDGTAQKYFYDVRKELREQNGTSAKTPPKKTVVQTPTPPKQVTAPVQAPLSKGASPSVEEIIEAINVLKGLAAKIGKDNLAKLLEAV
jgi:hypothetical protein